jgi:diacylglycerol O-acyltransferase / wax synthase
MVGFDDSYMRASDAFAWHMERDPALRSTIAAIMWLDRAPCWDVLTMRIDRISRFMLSLRRRVIEPPLRLSTPRWAYDPHFDLTWHLRRVSAPAPGTRDAVMALVRRSAMGAFDRDRPLWELTLVDGIEGGEAALILKIHHSLSDGVGGMRLLALMCDPQRDPPEQGEMPPAPPGERLELRHLVTGAANLMARRTARLAQRGAEAMMPALARSVRDPVGELRNAAAMARSVYRTAGPILDTMSPLMRERGVNRHLATMEVSLDDLKRAAKSVNGTVNDAYLTAVTGGLRRYHERHRAGVESLRVVMPISLRSEDDISWGNKITLQRLTVPVGEPDPATRMRLLHRATEAARKEPSLPVTDAIAGVLTMLPSSYVGGVLKHIDFVASNVPGTPIPIYIAGSKITGFFAFAPTIGASLNIALVSYVGMCDIGVNIDTAAVPDPEALLGCLQESFAEIIAMGATGGVPTG